MRSVCGWREPFLTSRSSATRMTPFVTARAPMRRRRYGARLPTALRSASWCCIPQKTKIVYCKDANRRGDFPNQSFDFLGFSFRARKTMWQGHIHAHGFMPVASPKALKAISRTIRRWMLHHRSDKALQDLAKMYNPYIQGWRQLLSDAAASDPEEDRSLCHPLGAPQVQAVASPNQGARDWFDRLRRANPTLFAHWQLCHGNGRTSGAV